MEKCYQDYILDELQKLLAIDSPSCFTDECGKYVYGEFEKLGFKPQYTVKGGVLVDIGGEGNGVLLSGHIDTLGAMVRTIKGNGRLRFRNIGGANPGGLETEWVRVYSRDGRIYEGTCQLENASSHVNPEAKVMSRNFDNLEIVLDEDVESAEDVRKLGITTGCMICFNPRFKLTEKGYIKSRYLDNKLVVAILLGFAKYVKEKNIKLTRNVWMHFSVYEEIGHGAGGIHPDGVTEILSLDMGCVGNGMDGSEKKVSICAADAIGPYDYVTTDNLIKAAEKAGVNYAIDIYPNYSSDSQAAVEHQDIRFALIGPGVYASHNYERSHVDSIGNTFDLLKAYLCE